MWVWVDLGFAAVWGAAGGLGSWWEFMKYFPLWWPIILTFECLLESDKLSEKAAFYT